MAGYKTWANGDALTGPDLQGYLMNQAVMTFASAAARDAALTAPTEGMTAYLQDVNQYTGYNGTAWKLIRDLGAAGSDVTLATSTFGVSQQWTAPLSSTYGWYSIEGGVLTGQTGGTINGTAPGTNDIRITNPHNAAWSTSVPADAVVGTFDLVRAAGAAHHFGSLICLGSGIQSQMWEAATNSNSFTALQVGDVIHCTWRCRI